MLKTITGTVNVFASDLVTVPNAAPVHKNLLAFKFFRLRISTRYFNSKFVNRFLNCVCTQIHYLSVFLLIWRLNLISLNLTIRDAILFVTDIDSLSSTYVLLTVHMMSPASAFQYHFEDYRCDTVIFKLLCQLNSRIFMNLFVLNVRNWDERDWNKYLKVHFQSSIGAQKLDSSLSISFLWYNLQKCQLLIAINKYPNFIKLHYDA